MFLTTLSTVAVSSVTSVETYGISGAELIVFGDQNIDIKMFRTADRSIAVADGTAELKRHATHIIGSNQEDSVVKYLAHDGAERK